MAGAVAATITPMKAVLRQLYVGARLACVDHDVGTLGNRVKNNGQVREEGRLICLNLMLHAVHKEEMLLTCAALEAMVVG